MRAIVFLGGGNMAEAIMGGMIASKLISPKDIIVYDKSIDRLNHLSNQYQINAIQDLQSWLKKNKREKIFTLAVKPQNLEDVFRELDLIHFVNSNDSIVSILAGTTIKKIKSYFELGSKVPPGIIRVMPNMAAFVSKSVSGIAIDSETSREHKEFIGKVFESIGYVHWVEESEIDGITAVSGSGPAYVFYFLECFTQAAKNLGFSQPMAEALCRQTLEGAQKLLESRDESADELRKKVTSKGGTTAAALKCFMDSGSQEIFNQSIKAAEKRSKELSG